MSVGELLDFWDLLSFGDKFGWRQRGELRPVGGLETNLGEVRAKRNFWAGKIWGRSGVWEKRMEFGKD